MTDVNIIPPKDGEIIKEQWHKESCCFAPVSEGKLFSIVAVLHIIITAYFV